MGVEKTTQMFLITHLSSDTVQKISKPGFGLPDNHILGNPGRLYIFPPKRKNAYTMFQK